jgi:CHASE2 domain-containing protein
VTILLTSAIKYVESTQPGRDTEEWLFAQLQRLLPSFSKDLPLLVIDMSRIPGGKDQVTSRETLKLTLTAIVAQRPAAVGVDLDFSPGFDGWQLDDDPKFFDFCLELSKESGVPIYLGVYRTIGENSDTWLGSPKYKGLAAALRAENDTMRLPKWIQTTNSEERLPLMSAALADSYRRSHSDFATSLARTVEVFTEKNQRIEVRGENAILFGTSLINFSRLAQIQRETSYMLKPETITESGRVFAGKMIVIGDVDDAGDHFKVSGYAPLIPGVFLIASAAYTLAVEPLYELNTPVRLILDFFLSGIVIAGSEFLVTRYVNKRPGSRFFKAQSRFIWAVILFVIVIGLLIGVLVQGLGLGKV